MTHSNPEPMTQHNTALVLVDHQIELMTSVRDCSVAELKHNVVGLTLAKAPGQSRQVQSGGVCLVLERQGGCRLDRANHWNL
ncbi:hypothetical protein [Mameliella sp.]|uniref:hypothetical protein n=1 Tax=Mameliella sp. TaxID=1924940 RepID=UPI003BA957C0